MSVAVLDEPNHSVDEQLTLAQANQGNTETEAVEPLDGLQIPSAGRNARQTSATVSRLGCLLGLVLTCNLSVRQLSRPVHDERLTGDTQDPPVRPQHPARLEIKVFEEFARPTIWKHLGGTTDAETVLEYRQVTIRDASRHRVRFRSSFSQRTSDAVIRDVLDVATILQTTSQRGQPVRTMKGTQ